MNIGETTATAKTLISEVMVVSPSVFEEQCKQPVAIMNAVTMLVMMAVHFISMYALFIKLEKIFNPTRIAVKIRQSKFSRRVAPCRE